MTQFELLATLLTLAALSSNFNHRVLRLPQTIGVRLVALVVSLVLLLAGPLADGVEATAARMLLAIDFDDTLLHGMLAFLLFAGALHVNLGDLAEQGGVIALLASLGVVGATFLAAGAAWLVFGALGIEVPLIWCLVFGSLIAPTDPIAVLGILKTAGAPKSLETKITGESLFNDGVAVVVFLVLLGVATGQAEATPGAIAWLFVQEAVGGALFGGACGWIAYRMLATVYALAEAWHLSAPIAIVVAGLLVGNHGRLLGMSDKTREHLDTFWEMVDEVLNAVLFLLIGMELLVLSLRGEYLIAGLVLIPLVLLARLVSVGLPVGLLRARRTFSPHVVKILTWGGLRGGISVALALSLPESPVRDPLVTATYVIVVFSILVQGLTIGPLLKRTVGSGAEPRDH
jgi:CPA1 family monovalent cation:H+ antiporter